MNILHENFEACLKQVYAPNGFALSQLKEDPESVEYGGCSFLLNEHSVLFRVAKTTPTKNGQFVTIWKRNQQGITQPFADNDPFDFMVICTRKDELFGQFIFPKKILIEKRIVSLNNKEGKRGIRVYPPWDTPQSRQAEKTQAWQTLYFLDMSRDVNVMNGAKELFSAL